MRTLPIVIVLSLVGGTAIAQPAGSAAPAAGSATPGSAAPGSAAGSAAAPTPAPDTAPTPVPTSAVDVSDKRKICADAMNSDPSFAEAIVRTVNEKTATEHKRAAAAIAKNEKHVILAYASMWVIAALFVLFLWRRQQALKGEIASLRRDLDAAVKPSK